MSLSQTPAAFSRSLETFKRRLSSQEIETFELATLRDLRFAVADIQQEQAQRRGYRNLNKIKPLVDFLQQYARVIEQFVSAKPDFLAFIWGPIKLCLQVASRVTDAFDSLLDAYARIGESLPLLEAVDNLLSARRNDHVQLMLANVYEDILKFHSRAIVFFKQRTWKIAFKTAFRSFVDMYGDVVQNLSRSKELLLQTASVQLFEEAQNSRERISREFDEQNCRDERHRKSYVIDWLSHVPCDDRHSELRRDLCLYSSSTRWVFNQKQVSGWFLGSETCSMILWILGIPGAGKTYIFSSIVEEIKGKLPNAQVIFFYCKYNDPLRSTVNDIVRCMIAQLLALDAACLQYLYDNMIGSITRRPDSTNALCTKLLETIALHHEQLFIGIDGLDECREPERRQILSTLHCILKASQPTRNVRVFLTSRKEKDIGQSLRSASRLEIRPHHLVNDIEDYVRVRALELSRRFKISREQQMQIIANIAKRPQGMFLLARLIMDNLLDQDCREDLEEELRDKMLPNGIDQAYARILDRMQKKDHSKKRWDRAKLGLDFLTVATRPLKIHEIQGILSIRLDDRSIDFENRKTITPLEELLGPIVEIQTDGSVNFIHPTAKEYLVQHHSDYFVNSVNAETRLALLCSSYLTFPCFNVHLDESDIINSVHNGAYAFQEYATLNWIHHVRALSDISSLRNSTFLLYQRHLGSKTLHSGSDSQSLTIDEYNVSMALDDCQKAYESVDNICAEDNDQEFMPYILRRVLEVRAILEELPAQLLKDSPLLHEAYGKSLYKCPMTQCNRFHRGFASRELRDDHWKAHERAYKCTIENCDYFVIGFPTTADLTRHEQLCHSGLGEFTFPRLKRASLTQTLNVAIDRDDASATRHICEEMRIYPTDETGFLFRAVKRQSYSAALVLLELLGFNGQLRHKDKDERTVLHEAVMITHMDLLKEILGTDVDVNVMDNKGRTPFSESLEHGHFDAARLLLGHRNMNLKTFNKPNCTRSYRKGFIGASSGGHNDIVRAVFMTLVEDSGKELGWISLSVSSALARAASNGHESTVATVLEIGREMGLEQHYSESLKKAIAMGMKTIQLLEEKPEVDKNGKTKGNALAYAALNDDSATVLRLLEKGADINYLKFRSNALGSASERGNLSMVQLLISIGADVNVQGHKTYSNALQAASFGAHDQVVRTLLEKGANVDARGGMYGSALQAAASNCHIQTIQILLEKRADVNLQGGVYGNALAAAAWTGGIQLVKMLLEKGADTNAYGGDHGSALLAASKNGHVEVVRILLEKGADVNAQCGSRGTALQVASSSGQKQVVRMLLKAGADVNPPGGLYDLNPKIKRMLIERGANIRT